MLLSAFTEVTRAEAPIQAQALLLTFSARLLQVSALILLPILTLTVTAVSTLTLPP